MRFFFFAAALAVAACSSNADESVRSERPDDEAESSSGASPSPPGDGGTGGGGSSGLSSDGSVLPTVCEGACRESSLVLRKGDVSVEFERTQFGFDRTTSYPKLKLSAYQGGENTCPAPGNEPNHALQIAGVPAPFDGTVFEAAAGLTATLYDFEGDVVDGKSGVLKSTSIQLTPVAASLDLQAGEVFVAFDVQLEFEQEIRIEGHVFSTHCPSIDQR